LHSRTLRYGQSPSSIDAAGWLYPFPIDVRVYIRAPRFRPSCPRRLYIFPQRTRMNSASISRSHRSFAPTSFQASSANGFTQRHFPSLLLLFYCYVLFLPQHCNKRDTSLIVEASVYERLPRRPY
jgi:hypothetical protein